MKKLAALYTTSVHVAVPGSEIVTTRVYDVKIDSGNVCCYVHHTGCMFLSLAFKA